LQKQWHNHAGLGYCKVTVILLAIAIHLDLV
jgi:hypothetical protein